METTENEIRQALIKDLQSGPIKNADFDHPNGPVEIETDNGHASVRFYTASGLAVLISCDVRDLKPLLNINGFEKYYEEQD